MHRYDVTVTWQGNDGRGTADHRSYRRDHLVAADGPPAIVGSSDPDFRGDPSRWNPEQLLVASLAQCHMLWYLHLCATSDVVVVDYVDAAHGAMELNEDGGGQFTSVVLAPRVTVAEAAMVQPALARHEQVPALCFIARSVNFPVEHKATVGVAEV